METAMKWIVGYAVAVGLGWLAVAILICAIHNRIKTKSGNRGEVYDPSMWTLDTPGWFVGLIERVVFTTVVALDLSSFVIAMVGWITVKMLYNWNPLVMKRSNVTLRSLAFAALIGNLVSMFFAILGGQVCKGKIWF